MNSLNRLTEDWPLEERRGRVPHAMLWHELFRYTGKETAEYLFRHRPPDPNPVSRFRNALTVADNMVDAWENVDPFTGSILLYYGALWLGHAVALATLDDGTMKQREGAHGLKAIIDTNARRPFLSAKIDFGPLQASIGIINQAFGGDALTGREYEVSDILAALPEMRDSIQQVDIKSTAIEVAYLSFAGLAGSITQMKVESTYPTLGLYLLVNRQLNGGWLRDNTAVYSYFEDHKLELPPTNDTGCILWHREGHENGGRDNLAELRALCIEDGGRRFLFPKIKQRAMSEYAAYLAILYVISTLARYHPDYWVSIQHERTQEYFIISEFLDSAEEKIPSLVLNHLARRTYVFRAS